MGYSRPFDLTDSLPLALGRPQPAANKLLGLELLRFGAALAVLFSHYRFLAAAGMPPMEQQDFPLHQLFWPLYDHGLLAVQIFWGISGYIFFWKYGAAIHSRAIAAREFFWLRFSRLYPLHIVTLVAVTGLQAIYRQVAGSDLIYPSTDGWTFARQIFIATDWGPPVAQSFNGPIWSISAEVVVYAAFFLLLRKFEPSARLCIAIVAAGLALQLGGFGWASIGCATYFFAGGFAALAPRNAAGPAGAMLVSLLAACLLTELLDSPSMVPIVLLIGTPCLLVLVSQDWAVLARWQRPIQAAGNLTYSSYLLHFPLQLLLAICVALSGIELPLASPLFLIVYLGVTLAVAAASYRRFELPAQRWLRRRALRKPALA